MKRWLVKCAFIAFAIGAPGIASAQNCAGFVDLQASNPFCANVDWIKNRGVTNGCNTVGPQYCPNDPTTRLQMAIFLSRLGKTLTPVLVQRDGSPGALTVDETPPHPVVCQTQQDVEAAAYPKQVLLNASFSGLAGAAPVTWRSVWMVNVNNTGFQIVDANLAAMRSHAAAGTWGNVSMTHSMDLQAGTTYRFGIMLISEAGSSSFSESRCQLTAAVFNRNASPVPDAPQ
jgi:hypothetical protein